MGRFDMEHLHDMVLEAAETERRMPEKRLAKIKTFWPEIKAEWLAYAPAATVTRLAHASSEQISRYDWLMDIMMSLRTADRNIIWMTAHSAVFRLRGPNWSKISKIMRLDRRIVKKKYTESLVKLHYLIEKSR